MTLDQGLPKSTLILMLKKNKQFWCFSDP